MPDRLSELLQQRRMIQEHLAWLDREIAAATTSEGSVRTVSTPSLQQPTAAITAPVVAPASPSLETSREPPSPPALDPDTLLAEYQQDPQNLQVDVKRGCFLYFGIAMAFLFLLVALAYVNYLRHRPEPSSRSLPPAVEKR